MQDNGSNTLKDVASQATDFLRRQAERRSREIGGRLNAAADELESTGEDMSERGQDLTATIARQLMRVTRRVGDYLENTDSERMLEDARRLAREQPWTVVAIGVVAGFALSRAIKHAKPGK
jgi:ElaB/YqjD/DUF883 family membrane-anchored ribosome-binding protein